MYQKTVHKVLGILAFLTHCAVQSKISQKMKIEKNEKQAKNCTVGWNRKKWSKKIGSIFMVIQDIEEGNSIRMMIPNDFQDRKIAYCIASPSATKLSRVGKRGSRRCLDRYVDRNPRFYEGEQTLLAWEAICPPKDDLLAVT